MFVQYDVESPEARPADCGDPCRFPAAGPELLHLFQREIASARAVGGIYTAPVVASGLDDRPSTVYLKSAPQYR
jgi:hypothetical protein